MSRHLRAAGSSPPMKDARVFSQSGLFSLVEAGINGSSPAETEENKEEEEKV